MNSRPKLLDLFCCAGGAGVGYHRAGFDVVGVDKDPQTEYPFDFVEADALEYCRNEGHKFDVIHASPPCQCFTKYNNCRPDIKDRYEDLIEPTRKALEESGKLFVIENVERSPLKNPLVLCGSMFGLDVRRHRLFESNLEIEQPNRYPGGRSRERGHARIKCRATVEIGRWNIPIAVQKDAMGIQWISNLRKLSESVPPAYTEYVGRAILNSIQRLSSAASYRHELRG